MVNAIICSEKNKATDFAVENIADYLSHKHITLQDESERCLNVLIMLILQ